MEKDNFENRLRRKVLEAESTITQRANKEHIWNTILQKQQSKRKWYYAAAMTIFIIGMVGILYVEDHTSSALAIKKKTENIINDLPKPQILKQAVTTKQVKVRRKKSMQTVLADQLENKRSTETINLLKEAVLVIRLPKVENVIVNPAITISNENKTPPSAATLTPEFTVQFKRGKPIDEVEVQTKEAIARLNKFKLSKDTSILANANEKQKGLFKIKF